MYLRPTPRRNKDGTGVWYLQLAHNATWPQLRRELDRIPIGAPDSSAAVATGSWPATA